MGVVTNTLPVLRCCGVFLYVHRITPNLGLVGGCHVLNRRVSARQNRLETPKWIMYECACADGKVTVDVPGVCTHV